MPGKREASPESAWKVVPPFCGGLRIRHLTDDNPPRSEYGLEPMRDSRFIAVHRGGPLEMVDHRLLVNWAADCAEHVLGCFAQYHPEDDRPRQAIATARRWAGGAAMVGEARNTAFGAHAAARATSDAAARAAGHAVATAHMADHALKAAHFAVQAVRAAHPGSPLALEQERDWQHTRLPAGIRGLILSAASGLSGREST